MEFFYSEELIMFMAVLRIVLQFQTFAHLFFRLTYLLNFMLQRHTLPCMHRCFHVHLTVTKRTQSVHTTSRAHTDLAQQMRTCVFQTLMEKT